MAGRRCWVVALAEGRLCVDTASGLVLRLERLDRAGQPMASFTMTELSYGLDLAPQIFDNPIPGGHGPLVSGLTQTAGGYPGRRRHGLFTTLVPTWLPSGLRGADADVRQLLRSKHDYAPEQRVRQVYADGAGRAALELIETLPGSAWDVTPAGDPGMRRVGAAGQRLGSGRFRAAGVVGAASRRHGGARLQPRPAPARAGARGRRLQ